MGIKQQGSPEIVFTWLATETGLRAVETRLLERQAGMCAGSSERLHWSVFLTDLRSFLLLRFKVSPVHSHQVHML